jgi:hypothetical protein
MRICKHFDATKTGIKNKKVFAVLNVRRAREMFEKGKKKSKGVLGIEPRTLGW